MDHSICIVTPALMRKRGADAFDRGLSLDDHGMNPSAAAIADWKTGWLARHHEVTSKANGRQLQECPP
jgi:hypothetical protein